MIMNDLISVIIPVYNVAPYIDRCIKSVLRQTYTNIEILLIDDGSTDGSGQICEQYQKIDERIQVYHKKNGGLSDARNYGIDRATGRYITFIDSDDYITDDCIQYLFSLLQHWDKAQISICDILETENNYVSDSNLNSDGKIYELNTEEAIRMLCYQKEFTASAYAKLYRKECFDKIRYPFEMLYEDIAIISELFYKAGYIVYGKEKKYCYFQRNTGIVRKKFTKKKMDYITNSKRLLDYVEKNFPGLTVAAESRFLWSNLHIYCQISRKDNPTEYQIIKNNLVKYRKNVLNDEEVRSINKILILLSWHNNFFVHSIYSARKKVKR